MKILFVVTDLDLGGAEAQVVTLACGFADRGFKVQVASMIDPVARTEQLDAAGVAWHSLGMRRGSANPLGIIRLRQLIRGFRPDVVHSHMVHANLLTRLTRLTVRMPRLITTAHNTVEGGPLLDRAYRLTDRLTDLTTNVSQASVQAFIDRRVAAPGRITFVANGLDLTAYQADEAAAERVRQELKLDGFTWLAIGRLAPEKDFSNLLQAWKLLPAGARLLIAGSGPEEQKLAAEAGPGVTFLGRRSDIPALMAAADALVLSSQVEGLPMVLLEAGAAGLPAVSTDVGGTAEIITEGQTGKLVPARSPEALARAMLWMMELPVQEREQLAAAAKTRIQTGFGLENVLDRWERIYAVCT